MMLARKVVQKGRSLSAAAKPAVAAAAGGDEAAVRKEKMKKAAAQTGAGKSAWQNLIGGVLDVVRPIAAAAHPARVGVPSAGASAAWKPPPRP